MITVLYISFAEKVEQLQLTDPMIRLLLGHSCLYPYNINSVYARLEYGKGLESDLLVVGWQKPRGVYRSIRSQKMIQRARTLSSAKLFGVESQCERTFALPPGHPNTRNIFLLRSFNS